MYQYGRNIWRHHERDEYFIVSFIMLYDHGCAVFTYAAGDAENDISMLKTAHIGIAMQNASEKVKENADIVTSLDNNNDGLLEMLRKYF